MEVSFFGIALCFYFLILFQNSQYFHNVCISVNFKAKWGDSLNSERLAIFGFFPTFGGGF